MSHVQFMDELVREYLLFRGFSGALKAFDADLKLDKDKGFRADKIVDQLCQHIYSYDLTGLREAWSHLDVRLFARLEQHFAPSIRKLENAVLKFYLVNAWENNKQDKITEFFNKLTNELISQAEWKDWFVFPFIKNPEEQAVFGVYFTRQWRDTLLVCLYNFLSAVYQYMPQPILSSFAENVSKMVALQKENDIIRKGLTNLINDQEKVIGSEQTPLQGSKSIMDDFFNITQEIKENENQEKILKTIMRNIESIPTSPKPESKEQPMRNSPGEHYVKKEPSTKGSSSVDARSAHLNPRERDSSLDLTTARTSKEIPEKKETGNKAQEGNFLFLSREEYNEHKSHIISIKFNSGGNLVASLDKEGNLKVWSVSPTCKTVAAFSSNFMISCLDWVRSDEKYVVCGTNTGHVIFCDIKEIKSLWSINLETYSYPQTFTNKRVVDIVSSPVKTVAAAVVDGNLLLIDLQSHRVEKYLKKSGDVTCVKMNRTGQCVIVGTQEGSVLFIDIRDKNVIETWSVHQNPVYQLEVTFDYTMYTLRRDKIHVKRFNHPAVQVLNIPEEMKLHPEVHGRLFCLDSSGTLILTVGINSGVIYKVVDGNLVKSLELGGHKTMLTCVDWSFANQCATCATASQDGEIKISTLLLSSL